MILSNLYPKNRYCTGARELPRGRQYGRIIDLGKSLLEKASKEPRELSEAGHCLKYTVDISSHNRMQAAIVDPSAASFILSSGEGGYLSGRRRMRFWRGAGGRAR